MWSQQTPQLTEEGFLARDYTIAYIVGLQHCGSTLFDLLLNAHSQAVTAGELFALPDYANGRRAKTPETPHGGSCTCGADSIWDCTFWTDRKKPRLNSSH